MTSIVSSKLINITGIFFSIPINTKGWHLPCRKRYKKSPSFLSIHMGVRADALPGTTECHHIIVEDWARMEEPFGTLFVSIPTLLDPSISPPGTHIVHIFSPDWIENWQVCGHPRHRAVYGRGVRARVHTCRPATDVIRK